MIEPLAVGVLVSGNGSNLQAIIDRIEADSLPVRIACVISNKADAFGLERARKHGIPAIHIDHRAHGGRESYDAALVETLRGHGVQLVVLAGFMRIVTSVLLDAFPNAVMNIHPALLPAFPGLHAQAQALRYGVKFSGCTVHFVDEGTDTGPIIIQAVVPVLDDDDEASLSARIQVEEHRTYPEAVRLFAERRLRIEGRKVSMLPPGA
ncbi:phosphoribosylglycinamide formyltransferase [Geobacter anodireducens]|uniref:Phosphoribosylglycinamide formyltransferase n=1 Tax=Geobacter anodireducens TaxID=1340425 RepID=A0ABR9NWH0_9BACT|nr:phosphoribosylglycinamide formyltransferase [Geobacter anodireducens]ANA40275.1 phosphoribosylglycinamide formyltransferase [Geobacter anodireducens]MBE2888622.1 phosphoribosylglycinamide formyltransferase [Geobacter anodireducens]HMN01575.1 phosphoribosylglycinamide formyltransferase [Geobacter anodireducens]